MSITKISPDVVNFDSALVVSPTLTIGDATAEDTKIVFDGNAQDYYIGLDDSADDLIIGLGSTVGTTPIISVDENKDVAIPDGSLTITTADNNAQLILISTDADASVGPQLDLTRNSASPAASDTLGRIRFVGNDDGGNELSYGHMTYYIEDPANGAEDGKFEIDVRRNSINRSRLLIHSTATVFNQEGVDVDFRVESGSNANMLVVDGGENRVGIGISPSARLHVDGAEDYTGGIVISAGAQLHSWFLSSDLVNVHNVHSASASAAHTWQLSGTEVVRITPSGLTFNGDTAAANALDDYEEGTWTPSVESTGSATFSNSRYTKVGRIVTMHTSVNSFSNTTSSTLLGISLPFTAANSNLAVPLGTLSVQVANITPTGGYLGGTNLLNLYGTSTSTSFVPVTHADLGGSTSMYISITYMAA